MTSPSDSSKKLGPFRRVLTVEVFVRGRFATERTFNRWWLRAIGAERVATNHEFRAGFEQRLYERWAIPLDALDLLADRCALLANQSWQRTKDDLSDDDRAMLDLQLRLHARAMLTASEIRALLRTGHADGALARWRTLHEVSVTMHFIRDHGVSVAERYIEHRAIRDYKAAKQLNQYVDRINEEPFSDDELDAMAADRAELIERFGRPFANEYGWAAEALGKERVQFVDIEKATNFDHTRPWYRLASEGQHAGPHGIFYSNAALRQGEVIIGGPSNAGLDVAGVYCAITLCAATIAFLGGEEPERWWIQGEVLLELVSETEAAFNEAAAQLERDSEEDKTSSAAPPDTQE